MRSQADKLQLQQQKHLRERAEAKVPATAVADAYSPEKIAAAVAAAAPGAPEYFTASGVLLRNSFMAGYATSTLLPAAERDVLLNGPVELRGLRVGGGRAGALSTIVGAVGSEVGDIVSQLKERAGKRKAEEEEKARKASKRRVKNLDTLAQLLKAGRIVRAGGGGCGGRGGAEGVPGEPPRDGARAARHGDGASRREGARPPPEQAGARHASAAAAAGGPAAGRRPRGRAGTGRRRARTPLTLRRGRGAGRAAAGRWERLR